MKRVVFLLILCFAVSAFAETDLKLSSSMKIGGSDAHPYGISGALAPYLVLLLEQDNPSSAGTVGKWDDISGQFLGSTIEKDITQTTGANQPTITAGPPNYRNFDGNDFMQQEEIDAEVGAVSYTTEGAVSTFTDAGQVFTDWQTASGNAAYYLVVHNNDATISWGYLGGAVSATEIKVYQDRACTTTGWNLTAIGGKTPSTYEVYKTNFGFVSDLSIISVIWPDDGQPAAPYNIVSKMDVGNSSISYNVSIDTDGRVYCVLTSNGAVANLGIKSNLAVFANGAQTAYKVIGLTKDGTSAVIYVNGTAVAGANLAGGGPSENLFETYAPFIIGSRLNNGTAGNFFSGRIALVMAFDTSLSAAQMLNIYNAIKGRYGL